MDFALRFALVVSSAFFAAMLVTTVAAQLLWMLAGHRIRQTAPARRASVVLWLRQLPWIVGTAIAALLSAPAFYFHEPRAIEDVSLLVLALAAGGLIVLAGTAVRAAWTLMLTARVWGEWRTNARWLAHGRAPVPVCIVDTAFPIVALIGWMRPVIVLARQVPEQCSPGTLRAILDHESAHFRRGDNLRRLIITASFDPMFCLPLGRILAREWQAASEMAADDDVPDRVALAEGLLWAARRTPGAWPAILNASAFEGDRDIERRVRRLLAQPEHGPRLSTTMTWALRAASAALVLSAVAGAEVLWLRTHALIEVAVNAVP